MYFLFQQMESRFKETEYNFKEIKLLSNQSTSGTDGLIASACRLGKLSRIGT